MTVSVQLALVGCVAASFSATGRARLVEFADSFGLPGASARAVFSMAGSPYLSEVAHFLPCKLCWYQRIAMYATAIVLVTAMVRRDRSVRPYALVLSACGAVVSVYHIVIENFPNLESSSCDPNNPCSLKWVEELGFITIPVMALTGFLGIFVLMALPSIRLFANQRPEQSR